MAELLPSVSEKEAGFYNARLDFNFCPTSTPRFYQEQRHGIFSQHRTDCNESITTRDTIKKAPVNRFTNNKKDLAVNICTTSKVSRILYHCCQ
jgi:hypothetical protein